MEKLLNNYLLELTKAKHILSTEDVQELWSGYGKIIRVYLLGSKYDSIIVKKIHFPNQNNHPKGWNTSASHDRKIKSYRIEKEWYASWGNQTNSTCRIPIFLGALTIGNEEIIVLEDMNNAGYSLRKIALTVEETKLCLKWLANFHAIHMNKEPDHLWSIGTYWHLTTRLDEWRAMPNNKLKKYAKQIDDVLNTCQFQTFVHGDAKVANFCFSIDHQQVAAVDFQYVGGGCGIKDVAYLLSSCLTAEECNTHEEELLAFYFLHLQKAITTNNITVDFTTLKEEWNAMYPLAWADFIRFLQGWSPQHSKLNTYSLQQVEIALSRFC